MSEGFLTRFRHRFATVRLCLFVATVKALDRSAKYLAVIVTIAIAYVLSIWPACWLVQRGIVGNRVTAAVYEPIFWLEFHAPQSLQSAMLRSATVFGVENAYVRMRNAPFSRTYPVGDFAFRWNDGKRAFDGGRWLLDWITTTVEPDSWEELSGVGSVYTSQAQEALVVFQTRRGHAAVSAFLQEIRTQRQSVCNGRNVDCEGLVHALIGFHSEPKFRTGCIRISSPEGERLIADGTSFANLDGLLQFLAQQPPESLRAGIFWSEWRREPNADEANRLKAYCQTRDVDLFVRPYVGNVIGQPLPRDWWVARASNSVYLDPE